MEPYRVFLHLDLLEQVPERGDQRQKIMAFIRALADNPQLPGDFTDQDDELRHRQIRIIGRHAVTYWVDEAVKAVMILDISLADR